MVREVSGLQGFAGINLVTLQPLNPTNHCKTGLGTKKAHRCLDLCAGVISAKVLKKD